MNDKENGKKPRKTTGAITLREVAELAGVSTISVSRAINSPSLVTPKLLEKIQLIIEQTGYVPNRMAGGLASSKSKLIAAIVPSTVISVFNETIESLNGTLFDSGYQLMLGQSSYSTEREDLLLESIVGRRPDGIFLTGVLQPGKGRNRLIAAGIPVVESWDLTPTPIDLLIGFSHADIGTAVAKFFLDKDHQNFAIVTADDERAERRTSAFCKAITDAGFNTPFIVNVGTTRTLRRGRDALHEIRAHSKKIDAVFCTSDLLALGVVSEARDLRIQIPNQLAIMGFGNVPFISDLTPALSTVRINGKTIGETAARFLIERAEGHKVTPNILDIGFSLIERETTR